MKFISALCLLPVLASAAYATDAVRLSGKVTDFAMKPLDSVSVILKNNNFDNLYTATTDKDGHFSMNVPQGRYYALYVIKQDEYGVSKLEYWAWDLPLFKDTEINPQYERMEIYGLTAFEPRTGPFDTYMIYFRPMSLSKYLAMTDEKHKKEYENKKIAGHDTIDIAPKEIRPDELEVLVNEKKAEILSVQKIVESARGAFIFGWMVQVRKPDCLTNSNNYDKITVILRSSETTESGKSDLFIEKK